MGVVNITPDALAKSALKFRKEILMMPVMALASSLQHMQLRPGIRYKEMVGEMSGDLELGPYSETRINNDDVAITGRELETFFGSVVQKFSPNSVYQSIYGSNITKGEGLKETDITKQVLAFLAAKLGTNLNKVLWTAVRNAAGTKSVDLFNGFDTITGTEITGGGLSVAKKNLMALATAIDATNAVDVLKTIWRGADEQLKEIPTKLFIPQRVYDNYVDDYQATVGPIVYNREFDKVYIEGSHNRCELVPLSNKAGTKFIHLTTKSNMLVGVNQTGDEEKVVVEKHEAFVLQFIATMFFGCQFETISPEKLLVVKMSDDSAI